MNRSSMDIYRPEETGALVFGLDEVGTIVSVFDKAVNIRVSQRRLVGIVRHAAAMTPMSILSPALLDSQKSRIKVGQSVNFSEGHLASPAWRLDLNDSMVFEGFPTGGARIDMSVRRMERFERILQLAGKNGGLLGVAGKWKPHNPFASKGREIVAEMLTCGRESLGLNLAAFSGLGLGFTPSGDDLICGFLIGEALARSTGHCCPDATPSGIGPLLDQNDRDVLLQAAEGTSDAGRTLIWMALQGRFPRFLCHAVVELSRAETAKEMLEMVTRAAQFGHTSGTDALTGLLLYLKTCLGNSPQSRHYFWDAPFVDDQPISYSG